MPANAAPASPSPEDTYLAKDVHPHVLTLLDDYEVSYNSESVIRVIDTNYGSRSAVPSSVLCVDTKNGNTTEVSTIISFTQDEEGNTEQNDFARALFRQTRDSYLVGGGIDKHGITLKAVTVFESYNDRQYDRAISEYFTCYKNGGTTAPQSVYMRTELSGDLYRRSGNNFTLIQRNYSYFNPYTVVQPAFNTVYSRDNPMASDQYVNPTWQGIGGFSVSIRLAFADGYSYQDVFGVYV